MDHIMTYEEYLRDVKKGIVTDLGNSPVTPLLLMLQGKWKTQILYELCIHDTVSAVLYPGIPNITTHTDSFPVRKSDCEAFFVAHVPHQSHRLSASQTGEKTGCTDPAFSISSHGSYVRCHHHNGKEY